jgi:hypothetical protein
VDGAHLEDRRGDGDRDTVRCSCQAGPHGHEPSPRPAIVLRSRPSRRTPADCRFPFYAHPARRRGSVQGLGRDSETTGARGQPTRSAHRGPPWIGGVAPPAFGTGTLGTAVIVRRDRAGDGCRRGLIPRRGQRRGQAGPESAQPATTVDDSCGEGWSRHSDLNRGPAVYELRGPHQRTRLCNVLHRPLARHLGRPVFDQKLLIVACTTSGGGHADAVRGVINRGCPTLPANPVPSSSWRPAPRRDPAPSSRLRRRIDGRRAVASCERRPGPRSRPASNDIPWGRG